MSIGIDVEGKGAAYETTCKMIVYRHFILAWVGLSKYSNLTPRT